MGRKKNPPENSEKILEIKAEEKKQRVCGKCHKPGHNAQRCDLLKEKAKIEKKKEEPERIAIEGIAPKKGLWIVHPDKEIVVGKIRKVDSVTSELHYTAVCGVQVKSSQENFLKGGYTYTDIEPSHLKWKMGLI